MKQILTVLRFEFLTFARSGTFIGITIFMMALALIGPAVPRVIQVFSDMELTAERRLALVDNTGLYDRETVANFIAPAVDSFSTLEGARDAVARGEYNYALSLHGDSFTLYATSMGMGTINLAADIESMLVYFHRIASFDALGVMPAQTQQIINFVPAGEIMTISPAGDIAEDATEAFVSNVMFSYVLTFVLYFSLLIGGSYLVTAVVREKSTKTMELLITSCKAVRLLNGKVFGVGSAVLTQLLLMVAAAGLSMTLFGGVEGDGVLAMFSLSFDPYIMGLMVVFFLLGFIMYAYMYAALASTVSRMEDANSVQTLPMMLVMAGFFMAIFGLMNPGAGWITVVSHVPFFAPFIMFMRICLGTAAAWEVAVSIAAQVVTIGIISWLGGRIYRMGTLMYGNKPKMKDLFAAFR